MNNISQRLSCCSCTAKGHIELIIGPMFSGKTTEMLRRLNRFQLAKQTCLIVRYRNDLRHSSDRVLTHDRLLKEAISAVRVSEVMHVLRDAHVVAIDEGQFFDDIAECAESLANQGKIVIISALDGDFCRKRFKNILDVCPLSENIAKLNAVCVSCGNDAAFTRRLTADNDIELIGGRETYTATCRSCYFASERGQMCSRQAEAGRIEVVFGPMFSGKTTEMLRRHNRHALAGRACVLVKYKGDTRYDRTRVVTHDLIMQDCISSTTIRDIFEELVPHTVIAIDEGQFFPDIVECCEELANMGKIVIVAALDGDYNRKEFDNHVLELCPLAEKVCKLRAVCTKCGGDAPFTKRLSDDTEQEVIGGLDKYQAMCRRCYLDEDKENCLAQHPPLQEIHAETPFCVSAVGLKRFKCDLPTHNC